MKRVCSVRHVLTCMTMAAISGVVACVLVAVGAVSVSAQTCGTDYTIKEGETLAQIAARAYGNPAQWTVIYYANQDRIGNSATLLVPGLAIRVPCIAGGGGAQGQASPAPPPAVAPPSSSQEQGLLISSLVRRIDFLTADNYPPYTSRSLEGGGMSTSIVESAMNLVKADSNGRFDFSVSWVNDWAAHLNPLLTTRAFDMGFPWVRPDCEAGGELDAGSQLRCQRFFFSDPISEIITYVYVRQDSAIKSLRTEELAGTTMCRPTGYPVRDFDQNGKNWLKDGKLTLVRPPSIDECFRLLAASQVDAVAMSELPGRSSIISLGLADRVRALEPPLSIATHHVIVAKSHPNARTMLYYFNAALSKLREKGDFDKIVERHLTRFWEAQSAGPNAALATAPAQRPAVPSAPTKTAAPTKSDDAPKPKP